jgi:hypothetical protein
MHSQLTLAWILAQGPEFIPIPGTTKIERLDENLGALKVTLSTEEEKEIRQACESATIHGGRYPEAFASALFVDTVPLQGGSSEKVATVGPPENVAGANNLI